MCLFLLEPWAAPAHLPTRPPGPGHRSHGGHHCSNHRHEDGPLHSLFLSLPFLSLLGWGLRSAPSPPPGSRTWCDSLKRSPALMVVLHPPGLWEREALILPSQPCLWGWAAPLSPISPARPLAGPLMLWSRINGRSLLLAFLASSPDFPISSFPGEPERWGRTPVVASVVQHQGKVSPRREDSPCARQWNIDLV